MTNEDLRRMRKAKPLTQAELAAAIGYSRQAVIGWETGAHPIPDIAKPLIVAACVGASEAKQDKPRAALVRDTVKYYGEMRRDGTSHASIMELWNEKNFVPTPEAQAGIARDWPDILNKGETK